jgi:hypothetical protein
MRLAVVAIVGLAACGVSRTGRAEPPRALVDPWAKATPVSIAGTELVDPWRDQQKRTFVPDELIDPWRVSSVPTARFPSIPRAGTTSTAVPTARFPVFVELVDPWKKP